MLIDDLISMQLRLRHKANEEQLREIQYYLDSLPIEYIIAGLRFAYNRYNAERQGSLIVGRRSKVKQEVAMLTKEQALWRLEHWKQMVKVYRDKGYSYPTIHRIKHALLAIVNDEKVNK